MARLTLAWLLVLGQAAAADTLLLVHGLLGSALSWRESGVAQMLSDAGWQDAGELKVGQRVLVPDPGPSYFTLSLDSTAPLRDQAQILAGYVSAVRKAAPHEPIYLVGHSAGGVISRLYMVMHPDSGVVALITFASPHLGADTAELGLLAGSEALPWLDAWLGVNSFSRLGHLLVDLTPEHPGNLLDWLNHQPHPKAHYVSVVRDTDNLWEGGDILVPSYSQDMNHVDALRGKVSTIRVPGGHELNQEDGKLLVRIINTLRRT